MVPPTSHSDGLGRYRLTPETDIPTVSEVLSETVTDAPTRTQRRHAARRAELLELAGGIVDGDGLDALTMTSLAAAADYAPASLYTYFASRSALLAALQEQALTRLADAATDAVRRWDDDLAAAGRRTDDRVGALARLWAFSDLVVRAPEEHPRDFVLQQDLLAAVGAETEADAAGVVPAAMAVLAVPSSLLLDAERCGAVDPADDPLTRTLVWVAALNGALLAGRVRAGLPLTTSDLADHLTATVLLGWGAPADDVAAARALAQPWRTPARSERSEEW